MAVKRIFINESVCIGCHLCEVYCQAAHSQSGDIIKSFNKESPRPVPRLRVETKGAISFSLQCRHCDDPPCAYACLTGALHKDRGNAVVMVDSEKCTGCWTCLLACPFGAIRQDTQLKKVAKCDLCPGKDMPVCVSNCPNEALFCSDVLTEPRYENSGD